MIRPVILIIDGKRVDRASCVHRGEVVEEIPCLGCKKDTMLKVYSCTVFGKCTLALTDSRFAGCIGCKEKKCLTYE